MFFSGNQADGHGGGVFNDHSSPTFTNVTFRGNLAMWGGGVHNFYGNATFANVTLSGNTAGDTGGGMGNDSSSPTLTNVTISGNDAPEGAGMDNYDNSSPQIRNTIIWGNTGTTNPQINNTSSSVPVVNYSVVQGGYGGVGNISLDPRVGTLGAIGQYGGFTPIIPLPAGSSAINTGDDTACDDNPGPNNLDQRGVARPQGIHCDIGAYEYDGYFGVFYAKPGGAGNCQSWANACDLTTALGQAAYGDQVWVAAGTYQPTTETDRAATFQLKNGVAVYGGFPASGNPGFALRDPAANGTTLSGAIGSGNAWNSHSYHVVTGVTGATLDGFTITSGYANGSDADGFGGGMFNYQNSPTITNVTFYGNVADFGGGMYNYDGNPTLTDVAFYNNTATSTDAQQGNGGGFFNDGGTPEFNRISFSENTASEKGGGMYINAGSVYLTDVTFYKNRTSLSMGGGINIYSGYLSLTNVTFQENTAKTSGGGIYTQGGTLNFNNVTFSGNQGHFGGGIYANYGNLTLHNATFTGNSVTGSGGGIHIVYATVSVENSIFWGNTSGTGNAQIDKDLVFGWVTSYLSNSVVQGGCPSSPWISCSNIIATDPQLGPLDFYGGYTPVVPILSGSSAIDSAVDGYCPVADQRGLVRPQGAHCDMGAFEYRATYFAKPEASGAGNCSSWENACPLQTALAYAQKGSEVWGMRGVYTPTASTTDRFTSFRLRNGVAVYGGFSGAESVLGQRNPDTSRTVLSGDIDQNDVNADGNFIAETSADIVGNNTYHVVVGATDATLDGFTITAGNANGTSPDDSGGGMYNYQSSPTLTNVTFSGNSAANGGGIYNNQSSPTITNATFSGNSAVSGGGLDNDHQSDSMLMNVTISNNSAASGGGMFNCTSNPTLINVTISNNSAASGGGIFNCANYPLIRNTILWGNTPDQITDNASTPMVSDSVIQGGYAGGANILTADPLLGALGKYGGTTQTIPLLPGSSAIDEVRDNCPETDQRGILRLYGACDIGAYESRGFQLSKNGGDNQIAAVNATFNDPLNVKVTSAYDEPVNGGKVVFTAPTTGASIVAAPITATISGGAAAPNVTANGTLGSYTVNAVAKGAGSVDFTLTNAGPILYAKPAPAGLTSGACNTWGTACELRYALTVVGSGQEIWVMQGVYMPTASPTDRTAAFHLKRNVAIYGGFDGAEGSRNERSPVEHLTILSGDIDNNDSQTPILTNLGTVSGNTTNSYNVVIGASGATLDGFTVTAGYAWGISGCTYSGCGGGMYNDSSSPTVTNVTFIGNSVRYYGGGMYNNNSSPILTNVSFRGNKTNGQGGGMYTSNGSPTLTLTNITFSGNLAYDGGGMYNWNSSPTLTNITFSGNSATNYGGGMYSYGSNPVLTNITFNANSAKYGGGVYNISNSNPQIRNTILWGNTASIEGTQIYNAAASTPVVSDSVVQGGYASGTNILTADPLLGALGDYGGSTQTIPLQSASSAIDAGNPSYCPPTDQRGQPRYDWGCDIGAFEARLSDLTTVIKIVSGAGTYTFGPTLARIQVTNTDGCLTGLQVQRVSGNHPNASANLQTGAYWTITPTGCTSGFNTTLTLPFAQAGSSSRACRWLEGAGSGSGWDCDDGSHTNFVPNAWVIRSNVSGFSDWAVGNELSPTAIQLTRIRASVENHGGIFAMLAGLILAGSVGFGLVWRKRRAG